MSEVAFAGLARQAAMVRAGEVSPTELVELHLERIERLEPELNAFRIVLAERARADAAAVEARLASGDAGDLPLAGVPIAIKDTEDLEGEVTTLGTAGFDRPAEADGEMVRRLRAAGAVVVGKTNLPELAIFPFTESRTWGVTRNPWDTDRSPGGSSGGSGAAVAAGLCAAASASDGGGSIRIPAAYNGLFGLKPQRDRIPLAPLAEHWHGLSVVGCLTRSVADTALWLDVCAGGSPGGPPAPEQPFSHAARTAPGPLRIAVSTAAPWVAGPPVLADEVRAAVEATAALLRRLGHSVEAQDPRWGLLATRFTARYLCGIADDVARVPAPERLERRTREFRRLALPYRPLLAHARRREGRDARRVLSLFERCDVLLMPTTGEPPIEVGRWAGKGALRTTLAVSRSFPYCAPWNHLGNPAASVPAGFTASGLPLAVQLVGRPNDEVTLLSLAAQLEAERPWAERRPPVS